MVTDLVYLLMGVMVMAMVLAAVWTQGKMSQRSEEVKPVEEEKIFVELGFEPGKEEEPEIQVIEERETIGLDEPQETFFEAEYNPSEPAVIDSPEASIEDPLTEVKPMFEATYEPSEPAVIDAPEEMHEPETVDLETTPMYEATYEPSEPVIIETPKVDVDDKPMFEATYEPEPGVIDSPEIVEEPETVDLETTPMYEVQYEESVPPIIETDTIIIEEEPPVEPEAENPEPVIEENPIEEPKPKRRRKERKPIRDESDPEVNMDMGVKKCPHCDSEVPDTIYCIYCGKSLAPEAE